VTSRSDLRALQKIYNAEERDIYVSALAGHLKTEYTIILGSYLTHNGSVVAAKIYKV
jgi:hypothetical protein